MSKNNEFNDLVTQCETWRRHLSITYRSFVDIDAEIHASMWEHFCNGITNESDLYSKVRVDVRRYVRGEARYNDVRSKLSSAAVADTSNGFDDVDSVVDVVGAQQLLGLVEIPHGARQWLAHRMGETDRMSPAQAVYGRRWASRTRKVLAHA